MRPYPQVASKINKLIEDFSRVLDTFDPPLREIRRDIHATSLDINSRLNRIMSSHAEALQKRFITMRYDRFVIPVKWPRKGIFKRSVVHDVSASGGTTYLEPAAVRHLNDRLRMLAAEERARIIKVLREWSDLVAPFRHDVAHLSAVVCQLEVTAAKASASHELGVVEVQFDDTNPLRLLGIDVIPTSFEFSDGVRCVCVTGPNMGGKTLAAKTLGVSVLMAKVGMFVPGVLQSSGDDGSISSRIPYFDKVLADIGDDRSLVQSLSTFSGHVEGTKRILAASTPESLVYSTRLALEQYV
ncbi:DNA mismatch repair protein MutS [Gracilaria domingensis]|nr:DNA mismatch repair protein MutS [Gracilaria domingensis]